MVVINISIVAETKEWHERKNFSPSGDRLSKNVVSLIRGKIFRKGNTEMLAAVSQETGRSSQPGAKVLEMKQEGRAGRSLEIEASSLALQQCELLNLSDDNEDVDTRGNNIEKIVKLQDGELTNESAVQNPDDIRQEDSKNAQQEGQNRDDSAKRRKMERKKQRSGVRLFMRHMSKRGRKVSENNDIAPQLIVQDGRFKIFDVQKKLMDQQKALSIHVNTQPEKEKGSTTYFGCIHSIKWKLKMLRFKYGDLVPLLRKHIQKIEEQYGTGVASVFRFIRWAILLNLALSVIWIGFVVGPTAFKFDYSKLDQFDFKYENIIDGKGKLQYTWMFYGSYVAKIEGYRIDYAYLILGLATFFGSLAVVLKSTVNTDTSVNHSQFTMLLLASWDFSLTSKDARLSLNKGIVTLAKDLLSEVRAHFKTTARSRALTAGAWMTIYFFMTEITVAEFIIKNTNVQIGRTFLEVYGLSLVFSILNAALPLIIQQLPKIEGYEKGSHILYVNVVRVFLLRFLNIIALLATMYNTITSSSFRGCGGTFIGQEFYKIILLDTAIVTVLQFLTSFTMFAIRKGRKAEPSLSKIVLQIVYRQALIWTGTFFCPVVPVVGLLAQLMVFFVNYVIITVTCKAPTKRRYIPVDTFTTTTTDGVVAKYSCGPFGNKRPIDVFEEGKANLPPWLSKVANWFTSAAVFPVILILSIVVYVQHLRLAKAKKKFRKLEKDHLEFQKRSHIRIMTRK
eukprot:gene3517-4018_t